jgi:tetratricopeptide (TPR) repeat protein
MLFFPLLNSFGQKERKMVREGVKDYLGNSYSEAEVQFRKALDEKPGLYEADYNIANSLYKQKKYGEAAVEYDRLIQETSDPQQKANLYHNLGNTQLMAQEYEKGIDAYKNSLRIRPDDEDTRYNLAYALQMLKQQQQQNQDKGQENKENNKQEKDQQKENQQNQNDQQDKNEEQKVEQQENQKQNISKQEAEQMLNAVENQEKEVKEKVDKKKAVARPISTEKDW